MSIVAISCLLRITTDLLLPAFPVVCVNKKDTCSQYAVFSEDYYYTPATLQYALVLGKDVGRHCSIKFETLKLNCATVCSKTVTEVMTSNNQSINTDYFQICKSRDLTA